MNRGIFRRIFAAYAAIILVSGLFGEIYIASAVRDNYIDNLTRSLLTQMALVARETSLQKGNLDAFCSALKHETGARVTVIRKDGSVAGDSDAPSSGLENHLHRPEIAQALLSGQGETVRFSDTLKYDLLYVARRIDGDDQNAGFIRMAVPLRQVDQAVNLLRVKIILVVLAILLTTGLFSLWQTDHLRRLLVQIRDFSQSLARGDIEKRLFLKNAGEFNEIAENLTSMSITLQAALAQSREEKNRLSVILTSVPDALLILDPRGSVVLWSASAREFFGEIPGQGAHVSEIVRNHEFSALIEEVVKTGTSGTTRFRIDYPEEKYVSVRVSPLAYEGESLSGFVGIFHDVSESERLERVRKDFIANVSHELKTPVTAIQGFAETLLDGALDDREHALKFLGTIRTNSMRINSLVDDLMTISKIELGVARIEKTDVELREIFDHIELLFAAKAEQKNVRLSSSLRMERPVIRADRDRLIQILANLVDNAIKFTEAGRIVMAAEEESGKVVLSVEDTGIGIPAKYVPRLGERFFRVDPARSRTMGGTGLGLAIVKHLVRAHDWDFKVESTPGKGTRVRIVIGLTHEKA